MKIYTGRGDYGQTNLIAGQTVDKDHPRVQAYGSLDELNALVGWIASLSQKQARLNYLAGELTTIQHQLYDIGTVLADPKAQLDKRMKQEDLDQLEEWIDGYTDRCPQIKHFILAGGHPLAAMIQFARTVCRRAERQMVSVMKEEELDAVSYRYINRLSDYFFALARYVNVVQGEEEVFYEAGGEVFHPED